MLKPFLIFLTMSGDCSTFLERFPRLSHFEPKFMLLTLFKTYMFAYLSINDLTFVNKRCFISLVVILNHSLRFLLVLLQVSFFHSLSIRIVISLTLDVMIGWVQS